MLKSKYSAASVAAAVSLILSFCGREQKSDLTETEEALGGIVTEQNTAVRISPMVFSGCIDRLEKGTPVEVIEKSSEKSQIARTSDFWYHTKLDSGITGWIYGGNLKLAKVKNRKQLDLLVDEFRLQEIEGLSQLLSGRWWSVNSFEDFTIYALELYEDTRYKSYVKGNEDNPVEGEYRFDMSRGELVFPQGTAFKKNLKFVKRGQDYTLFSDEGDGIRFKRIKAGLSAPETPASDNENQ